MLLQLVVVAVVVEVLRGEKERHQGWAVCVLCLTYKYIIPGTRYRVCITLGKLAPRTVPWAYCCY